MLEHLPDSIVIACALETTSASELKMVAEWSLDDCDAQVPFRVPRPTTSIPVVELTLPCS